MKTNVAPAADSKWMCLEFSTQGLVLLAAVVLSEFTTFPMLFYRFEHETLWYWHWSKVPAFNMCWSTIQKIRAATAMSFGLFRWHRCYVGAIPFCRHATHEVFSAPLVAQGPFQHMDRACFDEVGAKKSIVVCVSHCCSMFWHKGGAGTTHWMSTLRGGIL